MIDRTTHTLRSAAAMAAGRPAYAAGIRASIATIIPLAIGHLIGDPHAGTWMSFGGFNGALSDRGGSYASRARTMALLTVGGAIAGTIGALSAGHLVASLIATFAVAYAASVVRVWGAPGMSIGGAVLSVYVVSHGLGALGGSNPFTRAQYIIVGGLWAMLVALVLWPLRPYRPARLAVAALYRALAGYVRGVTAAAEARHTAEWPVHAATPEITAVRAAIENARSVIVQIRRGRPGGAERGERLLVLAESADQLFGHIVAASELLSSIPHSAADDDLHGIVSEVLRAASATALRIADGVEEERKHPSIAVGWSGEGLRAAARAKGSADPQYDYIATVLDRAAQFASAASVAIDELNGRQATKRGSTPARSLSAEDVGEEPTLREMFRATLSPNSLITRFALRVAVVTTIAVAITEVLSIPRGYWMTLTVIVILQPYTGVTFTRAVQRVLGTVLGALLAVALGAFFHDPRAILVIAAIFVACCVALLPLNYAAFSVFLTPTFVLLAEASAGEWNLAWVRAGDTLLGGALALLGSRVLWPSPEAVRFPASAASTLRAVRAYLESACVHFDDVSTRASDALRSARRSVGLATVNTEESLQRMLAEAHGDEEQLAPALTLLAYTRRITASIAALAVARHAEPQASSKALETFRVNASVVLDDLALAVEEGAQPAPLPKAFAPVADSESPLIRARIERLARQISTLHDAVARMSAGAR